MLFLQNWRAAIIPIVAIPVSLIGTFAVMAPARLLAQQPLAVRPGAGHRHRGRRRHRRGREHRAPRAQPGCRPREAAHKTMDEVGGALIAIALVLIAVFVPTAVHRRHLGRVLPAVRTDHRGRDGDLCLRLADPLAGRLPPCCCKPSPRQGPHGIGWCRDRTVPRLRRGFNWRLRAHCQRLWRADPASCCGLSVIVLVVYGGLIALTGYEFQSTPTGFIPQQDQGYLIVVAQLPPGSSLVAHRRGDDARPPTILRGIRGVGHTVALRRLRRRDLHQRAQRRASSSCTLEALRRARRPGPDRRGRSWARLAGRAGRRSTRR